MAGDGTWPPNDVMELFHFIIPQQIAGIIIIGRSFQSEEAARHVAGQEIVMTVQSRRMA